MAKEDTSQPPPPIASIEAPQMKSFVKLHILKKGEYILWTMKMKQYLAHTDYALWEVILNGNSAVQMTKDEADQSTSCNCIYARSRPNGKMIIDSIENGPYVRRMIATLGEPNLPIPVPESFHEQTDEELTEIDIKRMDADDQAIQTILLGLPEDVYAAVDSYETAEEIWERVRQMMKASDIREQKKKAKLFNE
nr:ribonuclease H-like domain-containing protein [Tanacetum cinerariifolium]